jgi:ribonuclease HI
MVYPDGTSKGRARYIIYFPSGTCTEQINTVIPGAIPQHAEIFAILTALLALLGPVNIVSDSQYVVKAINSIERARLILPFFSYSHGLNWSFRLVLLHFLLLISIHI